MGLGENNDSPNGIALATSHKLKKNNRGLRINHEIKANVVFVDVADIFRYCNCTELIC